MISDEQLNRIVNAIYAEPSLYGCMVGFHGNNQSKVLHSGLSPSINYGRVVVIVEEADVSGPVGATTAASPPDPTDPAPPPRITNRSVVWQELAGAGISCGLTVLSGMAVVGGVAAEVPTGGASTALVVLGWVGLGTSAVQCGNALVRVGAIVADPDGNTLQRWDENAYYTNAILVVDAVGVVAGLASLPFAVRNLLAVLERRGAMASVQQLDRMTRVQRTEAIKTALRQATRTPEGREAVEAALREAGLRQSRVATVMAEGADRMHRVRTVSNVLSRETARRLSASIRDVVGGVGGIAASATPSSRIGSASGSVNALIVHVFPGTPGE